MRSNHHLEFETRQKILLSHRSNITGLDGVIKRHLNNQPILLVGWHHSLEIERPLLSRYFNPLVSAAWFDLSFENWIQIGLSKNKLHFFEFEKHLREAHVCLWGIDGNIGNQQLKLKMWTQDVYVSGGFARLVQKHQPIVFPLLSYFGKDGLIEVAVGEEIVFGPEKQDARLITQIALNRLCEMYKKLNLFQIDPMFLQGIQTSEQPHKSHK